MGRGRKPTPKVLADLQGAPEKPDYLDAIASKKWDQTIDLLNETGNLSVVDGDALAIYCQEFSKWVRAEKELSKPGGLTFLHPNGTLCPSPCVAISKTATQIMIRLEIQFGLTPKSRTSVKQSERTPVDAAAKWADVLPANPGRGA